MVDSLLSSGGHVGQFIVRSVTLAAPVPFLEHFDGSACGLLIPSESNDCRPLYLMQAPIEGMWKGLEMTLHLSQKKETCPMCICKQAATLDKELPVSAEGT